MPTTPPAENAPFQGRQNGRMESAVEMLRKSTTAPNTFTAAAWIGCRADPFPRQQPEQHRQAKGAEAQQLETKIRDVRSGQPCQVVRARGASHRIPGGILRVIGDQAQDQKESGEQIHQSSGFVESVEACRS